MWNEQFIQNARNMSFRPDSLHPKEDKDDHCTKHEEHEQQGNQQDRRHEVHLGEEDCETTKDASPRTVIMLDTGKSLSWEQAIIFKPHPHPSSHGSALPLQIKDFGEGVPQALNLSQ